MGAAAVRKLLAILIIFQAFALQARAEPMREFVMSATYGVLAGALVGAASLAFTENPGENMNRVARGASLGLYAGILLGVYLVYVVPSAEEQALDGAGSAHWKMPEQKSWLYRISLNPILEPQAQKISGALLRGEILRF